MRAEAAVLLVLGSLAVAGCGTDGLTNESADTSQGKALFRQKCGSCHTLQEAGTQGSKGNPVGGPNLDDAFRGPRSEGFAESAILETVRHQIDYPVPPMPENLLEDEEADAVAVYVAAVAAKPGVKVTVVAGEDSNDPKTLFRTNCGSCHVLADAGTAGKIGPNLDQAKPSLKYAISQITNGGNGMPPFKGQLTEEQIELLAAYLVRVTR